MLCRRAVLVFNSGLSKPVALQLRSMHGVSAWKGLEAWRGASIDERRVWGTKNCPVVEQHQPFLGGIGGLESSAAIASTSTTTTTTAAKVEAQSLLLSRAGVGSTSSSVSARELEIGDLASWGHLVLVTEDPLLKAWLTHQAFCLWTNGQLDLGVATAPDTPGRPAKPELVSLLQCLCEFFRHNDNTSSLCHRKYLHQKN